MFRKRMALFAGIALFVTAVPGLANEKPKSKYRTITGCLSKPERGDEYFLVGKNGSTWEIHSRESNVALADHVGHEVRVRGIVEHSKMHNLKEDAKEDTGIKRHEGEHGHLNVTSIHRVGFSCRR
jgi:hypothetical protein